MKKIKSVLATAAVGVSLSASALVLAAPAHADYNTYQVYRSTMSECSAELRAAIQSYGAPVINVTPCAWNTYMDQYIGSFGYNY